MLKGTIRGASVSEAMVSFSFSGELSFSFFTAVEGNPTRRQIDLKFDVRELPVQIPKFGTEDNVAGDSAFLVSFANAAKHAKQAAATGELVNVVLFRPALSYNINGVIEMAACTHAQVLPERLERQLRGLPLSVREDHPTIRWRRRARTHAPQRCR